MKIDDLIGYNCPICNNLLSQTSFGYECVKNRDHIYDFEENNKKVYIIYNDIKFTVSGNSYINLEYNSYYGIAYLKNNIGNYDNVLYTKMFENSKTIENFIIKLKTLGLFA